MRKRQYTQKNISKMMNTILVTIFSIITIIYMAQFLNKMLNLTPLDIYYNDDFGFSDVESQIDFNNNSIDDYTDIFLGALADIENSPTYDGSYFAGGYPPDDIGVCTDVVWRAFKNAGYSLKDMVNNDITNNIEDYPRTNGVIDSNIDFRRVPNLIVFFEKYAQNLTLDIKDSEEWQAGDIVTFGSTHIGIISNKRAENGVPLLIHQSPSTAGEVNYFNIMDCNISGHFRFDATQVPEDILVEWYQS